VSEPGPRLYDISPPLGPGTAVFPGDTPLERDVLLDGARGDAITLSTLRATCHLGAHVDAPIHYDPNGESIDARPLWPFVGSCRVVRPSVSSGDLVTLELLLEALATGPDRPEGSRLDVPRLLISTGSYPDPGTFNPDFAALDPDLVDWLGREGVRLIGIDTPSVDPADSTDLPAHAAARRHDLDILEGIVLDQVPPGRYELIALPLRLVGFDGSPVRAVLREMPVPSSGGA
jgi:arylformamidase